MPRCNKCGKMVKYRKRGLCSDCSPKPFSCRVCGETDPAKFYKGKPSICQDCYKERQESRNKKERFTIQVKGSSDWEIFTGDFETKEGAEKHFKKYFKSNRDYAGELFRLCMKVDNEWIRLKYLRV